MSNRRFKSRTPEHCTTPGVIALGPYNRGDLWAEKKAKNVGGLLLFSFVVESCEEYSQTVIEIVLPLVTNAEERSIISTRICRPRYVVP